MRIAIRALPFFSPFSFFYRKEAKKREKKEPSPSLLFPPPSSFFFFAACRNVKPELAYLLFFPFPPPLFSLPRGIVAAEPHEVIQSPLHVRW